MPIIICNSFSCSLGIGPIINIKKGFARSNHGQRARVNHALLAHNHALRRQEIQITANLVISDSVYRTGNADLIFHCVDQGMQGSSIIFSTKIKISKLIIAHSEIFKSI